MRSLLSRIDWSKAGALLDARSLRRSDLSIETKSPPSRSLRRSDLSIETTSPRHAHSVRSDLSIETTLPGHVHSVRSDLSIEPTSPRHTHSVRSDLFVTWTIAPGTGNSYGVRTVARGGIYRQVTPTEFGAQMKMGSPTNACRATVRTQPVRKCYRADEF